MYNFRIKPQCRAPEESTGPTKRSFSVKKIFTLAAAILALQVLAFAPASAPSAHAEWYRWVDDEGKLHVTDDIGTIPDEKRFEMEVFKVTPPEKRQEVRQPVPEASPGAPAPGVDKGDAELYGGETLRWWKESFVGLNKEISELEEEVQTKERFVELFISGRRVGQIYGEDDVRTYESYSAELPKDQESLERLKTRREELVQRATKAGVPRAVRELLEINGGGEGQ